MNTLNTFLVPEEISAFGLITRGTATLVGFDPLRQFYAAPGGGTKPHDKTLSDTLFREIGEEVGGNLVYKLAERTLVWFYFDGDAQRVVTPQEAAKVPYLKLHAYFRLAETSTEMPFQKEAKFISPAFRTPEFFRLKKGLRPSLVYALRKFQGQGQWPAVAPPPKSGLKIDVAAMRLRLRDLKLHPDLIASLSRE